MNLSLRRMRVGLIEGGQTLLMSTSDLQELGYSVVAYPCGSVFTAVKALQNWARHLKELSFDEYFDFIGAHAIREQEKKFL